MSQQPGRFAGRVVIVTGASRGIGAAAAAAFAHAGATVIGMARSDMHETARSAGKTFHPVRCDFGAASVHELRGVVEQVIQQHQRIDVLVNNAGIIRRAPAVEYSEKDWDEVLAINLRSPFFLTQAVARWWIERGSQAAPAEARLKIINIASLLSFQGGILVPAYAASKHGIAGITKALANEWAPLRINVNAIAPGYIATENTAPLRADEARNEAIRARIPQGDWGRSEDIAGTCLFLASSDADYVNGAVINVDGGWLAR